LDGERGLTLLEVVIALLLFSLMAMFLLSGQARAADSILRARIEREMAELLRLRLDLAALEYDEYREGTTEGDFPSDVSSRILEEDEVLGDRFEGYRWEVTITETIGAGATNTVEVEGGDQHDLLFAEEGTATEDQDDDETTTVQAEEVDRMVFILVTVYPPRYDELTEEEREEAGMRARSAWTAVHRPPDEGEVEGE
jgi:prepilin-type N-terminal cleavage/methylation domain-containing protein